MLKLYVGPAGSGKTSAVMDEIRARVLAEQLGCKTLVCVGDAMNDASMLQAADLAFAPADCVPELKALGCCSLVRPCAEGSVAGVIEALEGLEIKE